MLTKTESNIFFLSKCEEGQESLENSSKFEDQSQNATLKIAAAFTANYSTMDGGDK